MRRSIRSGLALVLVLVPSAALALPPVTRDPPCRRFAGESAPVRVRWSGIRRTETCWFFSGPGDLGRDDHLGESAEWSREGDRVTLRFGPATFQGTIAGERVSLRRTSSHAYGAGWSVTETIEGTFSGGECSRFVGRYHYDECDGSGGQCPGHCHIDAALTIERR